MSGQETDRAAIRDLAVRTFRHAVNPDWDSFNLRPDPDDPMHFTADGDLLRYEINVMDRRIRLRAILRSNGRAILDRVFRTAWEGGDHGEP